MDKQVYAIVYTKNHKFFHETFIGTFDELYTYMKKQKASLLGYDYLFDMELENKEEKQLCLSFSK